MPVYFLPVLSLSHPFHQNPDPCSLVTYHPICNSSSLTHGTPRGRRSRARILQQPGRPCAKVKRVANAIAEAIAEPEPEAEADADAKHVWCWLPSEACIKAKRQLEQLNDLLKYMDIRSPTTVS